MAGPNHRLDPTLDGLLLRARKHQRRGPQTALLTTGSLTNLGSSKSRVCVRDPHSTLMIIRSAVLRLHSPLAHPSNAACQAIGSFGDVSSVGYRRSTSNVPTLSDIIAPNSLPPSFPSMHISPVSPAISRSSSISGLSYYEEPTTASVLAPVLFPVSSHVLVRIDDNAQSPDLGDPSQLQRFLPRQIWDQCSGTFSHAWEQKTMGGS